jgi:hypothetical protein
VAHRHILRQLLQAQLLELDELRAAREGVSVSARGMRTQRGSGARALQARVCRCRLAPEVLFKQAPVGQRWMGMKLSPVTSW